MSEYISKNSIILKTELTNMTTRFEGTISVDPRKVGGLIGQKGSNLKRVCQASGHGTFIVAFNSKEATKSRKKLSEFVRMKGISSSADSFYISSGSSEAVRRAAGLLKNHKRPSKVVTVSPDTIGTIIGRGGSGLRKICSLAGDNCYIVHKHDEGGFVVTADTRMGVTRAFHKIKDTESAYFKAQREFKRNRMVTKDEDTKSEGSNRYEGLSLSSDEDEIVEDENTMETKSTRRITLSVEKKVKPASPNEYESFSNNNKKPLVNLGKWGGGIPEVRVGGVKKTKRIISSWADEADADDTDSESDSD